MKIHFYLLLATTLIVTCHSQNKDIPIIYVDEDFNQIEPLEFYNRNQSYLFYPRTLPTDSATFKVSHLVEEFGKLKERELLNLKSHLLENYSVSFENNLAIKINYTDTLMGFESQKKFRKPYIFNLPSGDTLHIRINEKTYLKRLQVVDKAEKKCEKKGTKLRLKVLHTYGLNLGNNYDYEYIEWHKTSDYLVNRFFRGFSGSLIIRPNGEFWMLRESNYSLERVLKLDSWTNLISQYETDRQELRTKKKIDKKLIHKSKPRRVKGFSMPAVSTREEWRKNVEQSWYRNASTPPKCFYRRL